MVRLNMSEFPYFDRSFDKDGRGVGSEHATPLDVDGAKEMIASCADVPAMQRKTTNSIKPRRPTKFEGECRHCGWCADCGKHVAEAKDRRWLWKRQGGSMKQEICGDWSDQQS